jgi:acyl-CoA synthetase (AMP-forming)/AMP-acid ligase II
VSPGYFGDARTRRSLRTGDLGYVSDGRLYIVDRIKDLIIIAGRNFAPFDVEAAVAALPGLRRGRVAAFGVAADAGTEALHVVAEVDKPEWPRKEAIRSTVLERLGERFGVAAGGVLLVRPGAIPKTTSGKVRRRACRDLYLAGRLEEPA